MTKWSENLIETTRDVLYNMPVQSFSMNGGCCHLKNLHGRYGYIKIEDALSENYTVHVSDSDNTGKIESFDSINCLIEAGWAVD